MTQQSSAQEHAATVVDRDDAALLEALETAMMRYVRMLRRTIEEVDRDTTLTLPQLRCLQAIAEQGVTLTTQLARQMEVTVPTMTSRLDGLVERGFAQRQPDPQSRRQVRVSLTPAGTQLVRRYRALVDEHLRELLAPLSAAARARLLDALGDLLMLLPAPQMRAAGATPSDTSPP